MPQIRQTDRNRDIYDLRKKLNWPLRKIGEKYGLSHVRVLEIVEEIEDKPELLGYPQNELTS